MLGTLDDHLGNRQGGGVFTIAQAELAQGGLECPSHDGNLVRTKCVMFSEETMDCHGSCPN